MKTLSTSFLRLAVYGLLLLIWAGCGKKADPTPDTKPPALGTTTIADIKTTSAKATCPLKDVGFGASGNSTIKEYGICYGLKDSPTTADTKLAVGTTATATVDIVANLTGLTAATPYFVRGYAVYEGGTAYGEQAKFTSDNLKGPEVSTNDAADQTTTAFTMVGKITSIGTSDVTQFGHVLSASNQTPTTADTKTEMGGANAAPKDFKSSFGNLKPNTVYYVRAYATNATGTGYSEVKTIKTTADQPPTVTTADGTDQTANSFNITGRVTSIGTLDIAQFGHVLSESNQQPSTADTKTEMGGTNAPKDFKSSFGSLKANTTYYVRAYAINPAGVAYSDVKTVKTANVQPPGVSTGDVSNITTNAATVGMNITSIGTNNNIQAGVCWSSSNQNPTTADAKTSNGANSTQFFSNSLTGLAPNTTYLVRAYATNAVGTGYGDVKTFKTADIPLPIVTKPSNPSGNVGTDYAQWYFNVDNPGGTALQEVGICYSTTNINPTIIDSKAATAGQKTGHIEVYTRGLQPNTTYNVRAYAQTAAGVSYSEATTVKTQSVAAPKVSIFPPASPTYKVVAGSGIGALKNYVFTSFGAVAGGNLIIQEYGTCYSFTNTTPTISDPKTTKTDASQAISFNEEIKAIVSTVNANTVGLYVRIYATTNQGTYYSDVLKYTYAP